MDGRWHVHEVHPERPGQPLRAGSIELLQEEHVRVTQRTRTRQQLRGAVQVFAPLHVEGDETDGGTGPGGWGVLSHDHGTRRVVVVSGSGAPGRDAERGHRDNGSRERRKPHEPCLQKGNITYMRTPESCSPNW